MAIEAVVVVDLLSLFLFGGLVILGWLSGALRQVVRLIAIGAVIVGVPFVAPILRSILFRQGGTASPGVEVASMIVAGVLIYVAFALAGWVAVKVMRFVSTTLSIADRAGGAALGGVKGLVVIYLCAMLLVMMEGPLSERDPDNRLMLRGGWLTGVASDHNVLAPWHFRDLRRLHGALRVGESIAEHGGYELVREDEAASEFLRDQRVVELLEDEELMDWVQSDHYPMTLADPRIREVLNDAGMVEQLQRADWEGLKLSIDEQ